MCFTPASMMRQSRKCRHSDLKFQITVAEALEMEFFDLAKNSSASRHRLMAGSVSWAMPRQRCGGSRASRLAVRRLTPALREPSSKSSDRSSGQHLLHICGPPFSRKI